ncbi:hypothetical protein EV361DRAFT_209244 [Lentinula raphanica]|nr:hypothetical protein EV361DRAFT_209244 [Lentinula raphanica]
MPQHELELSRRIASHPTNDPSSDIGASSGSTTSIRGSSSHLDMHDVELIWSERIKLTNTTSEPSTLGLGYHGNRALMDPKELSTLVNASHSTLPKPATKTTRTKNQIRMACTFCRARKIACSPGDPDVENGPCNQCQKRGQKCVPYSTRDSSHGGQDHIGIKEAVVDAGVKMAMMSIDPRISSDNIKENDSYVSSSKWEPLNES